MVYGNGVAQALGAIVDANGYILTKYSELQGDLLCQLNDGRRLDAHIVGVNHQHDLAMLKVDATDLPIVEWADSPPRVGGWVVTVGFDRLPAAIGVVSVEPRQAAAPSGVLGVVVNLNQETAKISEIRAGSGAAEAGLKVGDEVEITARPSRVPGEFRVLMVTLMRPSDGFGWGRSPGQIVE